jgi:hypothetical protein
VGKCRIIEIHFWKQRKLVRTVKVVAANMSLAFADRIRGCMAVYVPQGHAISYLRGPLPLFRRSSAGHLLYSSHIEVALPAGRPSAQHLRRNDVHCTCTYRVINYADTNDQNLKPPPRMHGARGRRTSREGGSCATPAGGVWPGRARVRAPGLWRPSGGAGGASVGCWCLRHAMRHITSTL